eukprot:NODE_257_length_11653_cov_0.298858.p7 type:complete len:132 gc:universal NODE_257_length_11653_cov_0.298858:11653-11258(-)
MRESNTSSLTATVRCEARYSKCLCRSYILSMVRDELTYFEIHKTKAHSHNMFNELADYHVQFSRIECKKSHLDNRIMLSPLEMMLNDFYLFKVQKINLAALFDIPSINNLSDVQIENLAHSVNVCVKEQLL